MSAPGEDGLGGVSALGGGVCSGGSAPGGGCSGGIPACFEAEPPCEQNDRQV